ncbi:hypothetical protein EC957_002843 [Mortierella hygrophila]|uniref:Uncharacterized protein n=1 Tax=Mortierella hygrophila TaxID=979708 RepID=A0A9P6FF10_9FUNG|nr:hypothetical protein EC957_002843 [Mortierella hygrophila]
MYIEASFNIAKKDMKELQSSASFNGVSKLLYGAGIMRNKPVLTGNYKSYLMKEMRETPMMWQEMHHNLEEDSDEEDSDEILSLVDESESTENEEELETDKEDF